MAKTVQCENCGAVLLAEDIFCGECGAPRPSQQEETGLVSPEPAPTPSSQPSPPLLAPPAAWPVRSPETGWRVAMIVLLVLGAVACCIGLALFLLAGVGGSETTTTEEAWLTATGCCLLPIGGAGALLLLAGWGIWRSRLRERHAP